MTLQEKIGQMTLISANLAVTGPKVPGDYMAALREGRIGAVSVLFGAEQTREVQRVAVEETRLGIPLLFALDVIHGHRTVFPIPLAEAATFDPDLWERTARASALEATADGVNFNYAPMLDVSRDPRWGRIAEGPGEDPWLASRFAVAKVRGTQGDDIKKPENMAATAKHLAAYGAAQAGRDYHSVDISERTFLEVYMPPFKAAVDAGAVAIMPGFHDLAGVPMTANKEVLNDLVRDQWGFDGVMVSDYNAVTELLAHGAAGDMAEAAAAALKAGVDIDLMGDAYAQGLAEALERGLVSEADIDRAVRRILDLKEALGLFDQPFSRGNPDFLPPLQVKAHQNLAREAGKRSIVLLTNHDDILPLSAPPPQIAVIGPLADNPDEMLGPWSIVGKGEDMVSILEGIETAFPACEIAHAAGGAVRDAADGDIAAAVDVASRADLVILCLGEEAIMSGEAASRAELDLPGRQSELARTILDMKKPVIALLCSGRQLCCPWLFERADAVLATWFLGSEAGHAIGDVLSGRHNPSGRLPVSWPVDVGQIPIHYQPRPTGRHPNYQERYSSKYLDLPVEPQFPFGHGLSYTRFEVTEVVASPTEVGPGDEIVVQADVINRGERAGEETVLLFVHDPVASLARPVLELKGMAKAHLEAGQKTTLRMTLNTDDLAFLGHGLKPVLEPGDLHILVGPNADRSSLKEAFIRVRTGSA
ncbi:MAG: glycoside hydrolase family 3 C-terminal domain-containing protein [Alphaproteobacteria bacterium]|nr:glycoside hydrolase family 3 C-terminal domain-containing protein [Alphaproteobacteria bacterium]